MVDDCGDLDLAVDAFPVELDKVRKLKFIPARCQGTLPKTSAIGATRSNYREDTERHNRSVPVWMSLASQTGEIIVFHCDREVRWFFRQFQRSWKAIGSCSEQFRNMI
jgi:hypothetical protein